ncbi:MAG: NADH:flavin oxidoreductase [Syntrophomonadaceae bacterium]
MSYLTRPLSISNLYLHNRLVMPPMATTKSDQNGKVNKEILSYYDEKSKGGYIGLIIIEHCYINLQGKVADRQLSAADDSVIEGLSNLAETIHNNGSKAIVQINHGGSAVHKGITDHEPVGPSAIANPRTSIIPRELSSEEIKNIVKQFANAALRVKAAGFDGVELHSAHGYLLNQFFSPLTNKRTDEYGGDVLKRIKIHLETIEAIRRLVGHNFSILVRLGACDYKEGGTTIEDSKIVARELAKAGIDILDVSGGMNGSTIPGVTGQGYFSPLTEALKKVVSIPVILTGGITDVYAAENLLSQGKTDLIGVGRAIYKDSRWAQNAMESL